MTWLYAGGAFISGVLVAAWLWPRLRPLRYRSVRRMRRFQREMRKMPDGQRRALVTGGLGAAAVAAATGGASAVLLPKPAKAQFGGIDLGPLEDLFTALLELFQAVLTVVRFPTPGRIIGMVDQLLDLLFGTDQTFTGGDPQGPMDQSYPWGGRVTPEEQQASVWAQTDFVRARVLQAMNINGAVAQVQGELGLEEEAIVEAAYAGAAGDFGLVSFIIGIMELQRTNNLRVGQTSSQHAQIAQMVADLVMMPIHEKHQAQFAWNATRGVAGDDVREPVVRPAQ